MSNQPKVRLPPELWAELPQQAQALFSAMQSHVEELQARVRELESRLAQNSQNSSRPPSSDFPRVKNPEKLASTVRRKRGAQPEHPGHCRIYYSEAEVDEVVELHPSRIILPSILLLHHR